MARRGSSAERDHWRQQVFAVDLPRPFDMDLFCQRLAERRGRRLDMIPALLADAGVTGLWVPLETADVVYYEQDTTPLHQQHIQLHELGHMLYDHAHEPGASDALRDRVLDTLDLETLDRLLARRSYDSREEQEAEGFARLVGRLAGGQRLRPQDIDPEAAATLHRAMSTFGSNR